MNELHWTAALRQRFATLWWLKAAGSSLGIWAFFQCYFYLLLHPPRPPVRMPQTWIDSLIPFGAHWVLPYFSLWVYVVLPAALQACGRDLLRHATAALLLALIGLAFYFFFPTTFAQESVDWSAQALGAILQQVDRPGNVFPSLHVAFALFAWFCLRYELRCTKAPRALHLASALWCAGIVYSTLATRQHIFWDALSGAALGSVWGALAVASISRTHRHERPKPALPPGT